MTKQQAVKISKKGSIWVAIPKDDKPTLREAWSNYTGTLCKSNAMSQKQYGTWLGPIKQNIYKVAILGWPLYQLCNFS